MSDPREARLRLLRSANVGPVTWRQLIVRYGSAEAALEALPMLAARGGGRPPAIADPGTVRREIARVEKLGARYLFLGDDDYPPLLAELDTAPPALIVRGRIALATGDCAAMVGARNASAAACRFARQLALGLGEAGVTVVSGLARGIDTAAHIGALAGGTIGVIASGIDVAFPPENAELQERVAREGLLIAEQPPGTEPLARFFPSRNRIIAGLATGTVVVEAAPRSGSLITARIAAEAGREVMAVPGSPLDPRAQGCNLLIREGATLVQSVDDILEMLRPIDRRAVRAPVRPFEGPPPHDASDADRRAVTALLGPVPVSVDELIRQSGLAPALVQTVLLELELAGRLERHAGGRTSLAG
ncbi:DNA processing protein [Sphingomonas naasensis]|uniref:DNA-protecting protein DprA n=1 Tax=Sphingomonas naasensis TaxID=1344951 RepID=A0A4S1WMK6_9SPHN|nr:DNA-processing protein DprA [Sphingomonas naasensis]NIJ21960.1 DNA processing protein [Sphingomonas naasensis]TGX42356.1 DNA-protecting protein DprA [Sphingomonas naasensis]